MPKLEINLPPELEGYEHDIRRFVDAMVYKLATNAHKGKWEDYSLKHALFLLREETKELEAALGRENMVEILLEAADIGNFALIVSAIAIERGANVSTTNNI